MRLPAQYAWLGKTPGLPRMVVEALKLYDVREVRGVMSNPVIMAWADEVAQALPTPYNRWAGDFYNSDEIPWCGLWMAVITVRSNIDKRPERNPPDKYLAAASWATYGIDIPSTAVGLGDILVFKRTGGHHVGIYVGEDVTHYHVMGANQDDAVNIMRIEKRRCIAARRTPYMNTPASVKKMLLAASGRVSTNEA